MGQASSLPTGVELRGYYEAALAFIDSRLPLEASLDEITAAVSRRQAELARRPLHSVNTAMQELAEALLFIQRAHPKMKCELARAHQSAQPDLDREPIKLIFEAEHAPLPAPVRTRAAASPATRGGMAGMVVGSMALKPQVQPRAETLEMPQPAHPEPARLPEDHAWPIAAGLLLITWQAWLAGFSGWAVARLFVWPAPSYGLELAWPALSGVIALGSLAGLGVLLLARAYRVASHRLGLLVHLSAVAVAVDLLAWWLAARRWPGLVEFPGWGAVVLLGLAWLAAWGSTARHDARVPPPRKPRRARN